jgi:hypothetical protein
LIGSIDQRGAWHGFRWFLFDEENGDLHILAVNVWPQDLQPLEPEIEAAVKSASWIPLGD